MSDATALKDLLFRVADDELIMAHRNSEWTGLGPILEEDIAFSSIAQDKLGHAHALYEILHTLGEADADTLAFTRNESDFRCCQFVEYPIGDYAFSLMRHFLFDTSEAIRYEMFEKSSLEPLAKVARKIRGEIKYHLFHANTWVVNLGTNGSEESHARMQSALNETFPLALGIFEPSEYDEQLALEGVFPGEDVLKQRWLETIAKTLAEANLVIPDIESVTPAYGGRKGYHTEYLQPLLEEMGEVFRIDPTAEW
jgi:ring-1,2-phenylacetyl-CoA epoxidase subunit PaaC